jgi:hypothetical protein
VEYLPSTDESLLKDVFDRINRQGPDATSQDDLDQIYSDRDEDWENASDTTEELRDDWHYIAAVLEAQPDLLGTRMRNQGDFYALVGAIHALRPGDGDGKLPKPRAPREDADSDSYERSDDFLSYRWPFRAPRGIVTSGIEKRSRVSTTISSPRLISCCWTPVLSLRLSLRPMLGLAAHFGAVLCGFDPGGSP